MSTRDSGKGDTSAAARGGRSFCTTNWSLVVRAVEKDAPDSRGALEELCRKYWSPLYRFARRRGRSQQDAEDLTQGFFAELLRTGSIARADADRGRFRTFLLTAFRHYESHERERAAAQKRGGGYGILSLEAMEEAHEVDEPSEAETPSKIFERAWAMQVLEHALGAVRRDYAAVGKEALFEQLKGVVWGEQPAGYASIANKLGLSEGAARVAVHRLRRRFRDELRAEVAATVDDPRDVDEELHCLMAALGS